MANSLEKIIASIKKLKKQNINEAQTKEKLMFYRLLDEILCKVLAHNIVVLVHEICELGINVDFPGCAKMLPAHYYIKRK